MILELASPDSLDDYRTEAVAVSGFVEYCHISVLPLNEPYIGETNDPILHKNHEVSEWPSG